MVRIDVYMVERGLATSRNRAQELIASGRVSIVQAGKRQAVKKPSLQVDPSSAVEIQIEVDKDGEFVSRGGLKMQGALKKTALEVRGFKVLDLGISTGGFADCLLQAGASRVIGVDVGHGQLASKLQNDSRVTLFEGVNARDLSSLDLITANNGQKFDLIVADLSFISLTLVLPGLISYLKESAPLLSLVKPQFEVGREHLGKNGVVKDASLFAQVETKIRRACQAAGLIVEDYFESPIEGSDGNKEFFVYAKSPELALDLFSFSGGSSRNNGM